MAVLMPLAWDGMTPEQDDRVREAVNLDADPPAGVRYHLAAFDDRGAWITEVWESAEPFQAFGDTRLISTIPR
jgi:hypothetical protein